MSDTIQIESPQSQINRARYAGKDFFTFVDDIIARIQLLFVTEFNDFVSSGTGQMLIDIVSWAAETLSFYIDRQATESYLSTARTRKAVNRLTRQVGYKMRAAVASTTDLEVNLEEVQAFAVTIPFGFQFQGPNGLIFEATEDVTFPAGEGPTSPPRTVSVREGTTRVEFFTSNGTKNQVFRLNPGLDKFVASGSIEGRVDGIVWEIVEFITFDQTDQFEAEENDVPPKVRFGDGVAGNIPPSGTEIRIEYLSTSGRNGLVQSSTIVDVVDPLVIGASSIPLVITNPAPTSGGDNPESLASAKANAPRYFKARQVSVTREDYVSLSVTFTDPIAGAVAVAQAFVARGADDDLQLQILISNIRALANAVSTGVQPLTDQIRADAVATEALRVATDGNATDIASAATTIGTEATSRQATSETVKDSVELVEVDTGRILDHLNEINAAVDVLAAPGSSGTGDSFALFGSAVQLTDAGATFAFTDVGRPITVSGASTGSNNGTFVVTQVDGPTQIRYINSGGVAEAFAGSWSLGALLSTEESDSIKDPSNLAITRTGDVLSAAAAIGGDADTLITSMVTIQEQATASGVSAAAIQADMLTMQPLIVSITSQADQIDTLINSGFEGAISDELDAIFAHVDSFLAADCQANLIEVPILVKDVDGFLQEPSNALRKSLQSFLDARKEVTQVPEVVSGGPFLVAANITATVGILSGFVQATVLSNVTTAIDNVLKDREFGKSLRLSDLYTAVVPNQENDEGGVDGVSYAIIKIVSAEIVSSGDPVAIDSDGNLIIGQDKVITKGTLGLTAILVTSEEV